MTDEEPGGVNLESVMYRLMEYQPGENTDKTDTMIMLSLVNLLGIISVMNKQSLPEPSSRPAREDPMMPILMSMLAQSQQPSREGPGGGMNPALLMSLLGSKGQKPENALLMGLLSSLMQPPPPPPRPKGWERERRESSSRPGPRESALEEGAGDIDKHGRHLSWDRRLG
ncbi:MAG: hypothetical protein M1609_15325 [Firmicutes bacterium]|nr:hypothetical protein [Bacillota bacterium]MCL5058912.1 hypothetical protein [Actinomycetota bacterium]